MKPKTKKSEPEAAEPKTTFVSLLNVGDEWDNGKRISNAELAEDIRILARLAAAIAGVDGKALLDAALSGELPFDAAYRSELPLD